ncbi:MAG: hypothetical protein OEZ65_02065 [Gemmatimonadota bacterium]|nr:hypothetical protein [Gemmatimonadota bacterium]MDH5758345.1 hypothetical protein [Gemmatimonadota bacterium]
MHTELISEVLDESGLGIKIRVDGSLPRVELRRIGEEWAASRSHRASRVWVWLYGHQMDEDGPAMLVTYLEPGRNPVSDFIPASTLLMYYLGEGGLGAVPRMRPTLA